MNQVIEYDPITGEELEFGCIMRGTPDKNGECSPSAHCAGCDQARRIRAKKAERTLNLAVN